MGELVSRDEAKMAIEKLHDELVRERAYEESQGAVDAMHVVLRLPAVEAAPVVHGRWIKMTGMMPPEYHGHYCCSECGWHMKGLRSSWAREEELSYCPKCGAKIDGEQEAR